MSIGYACLVLGEEGTALRTCILKNASEDTVRRITASNLAALDAITDYNIARGLRLFRISSEIIPFASHPANTLGWQGEFADELERLGKKLRAAGIRVSTHPGQYTVIGSPDPQKAQNAVRDLEYHASFLKALGAGTDCKMVLHVGGVYGDKTAASGTFIRAVNALPEEIRCRLVIENDDRNYTVQDVLVISEKTELPVVFDVLHHELNPPEENLCVAEWITACATTWRKEDGRQKIHYSQKKGGSSRGAHSGTIELSEFLDFYNTLPDRDVDIMLEVKDKNISAVKCINAITPELPRRILEEEWARYKYLVMEKSGRIYADIGKLFAGGAAISAVEFYSLIDRARVLSEDKGAALNTAQHIWGYVNAAATTAEKRRFEKLENGYRHGEMPLLPMKNHLLGCAVRQGIPYLIKSYYFYL